MFFHQSAPDSVNRMFKHRGRYKQCFHKHIVFFPESFIVRCLIAFHYATLLLETVGLTFT